MKAIVIKLLCIHSLLLTPFWSDAGAVESLIFGIYANDKASEVVKSLRPLLDALEAEIKVESGETVQIDMKVSSTYKQGVDDLVHGKVDFSRFGPASYIEAKILQPAISIIAVETLKGKKSFRGVICVKDDSTIKSIRDLKGKRFAFGAQESTIGRYLAQDLLLRNGIRAADLAAYEYLGRHDKVGAAVAAGLFDAGALKEDTFLKLRNHGQPLREIGRLENATKPWLARRGLPQKKLLALRNALLKLTDVTSLDEADGFTLGDDGDYKIIRNAMKSSLAFEAATKH